MLQVDKKTIDIGTGNCQLLKKDGHILIKTSSYGSIPIKETAIKLKGTEGHMKVARVGEFYGDSKYAGSKFGPPQP